MVQAVALCVAAAVGASLLYWQKSGGALQDREIGRIVQATQAARARTATLKVEWAALDDPGRLQDMADRLLALRPVAPAQFVEAAALPAWLEAPASIPPAADPDVPSAPEAATAPAVAPNLAPDLAPDRPAARTRLAAAPPVVASRTLPLPPPLTLAPPPPPRMLPLPPEPPRPMLAQPGLGQPGPRVMLAARLAGPRLPPAREAATRFELPRWLTQGRSPPPAVLALSGPPRALAQPALRSVAAQAPLPQPAPVAAPRPFAVVAASSGEAAYDDRPPGWYSRAAPGWPYGPFVRSPYGGGQPYGQGWPQPYGQRFPQD